MVKIVVKTEPIDIKDRFLSCLVPNLNKIDVVPNPLLYSLEPVEDSQLTSIDVFKTKFNIYCFDDTTLLDKLKNNYHFEPYTLLQEQHLMYIVE